MTPQKLLGEASAVIDSRGATRDTYGGRERTMAHAVKIFNARCLRILSEREGWVFMQCLKQARIEASVSNQCQDRDSYVDLAGYVALEAECNFGEDD